MKRYKREPYDELKLPDAESYTVEQVKNQIATYQDDPDNEGSQTADWQLGYICALRDVGRLPTQAWLDLCRWINMEQELN